MSSVNEPTPDPPPVDTRTLTANVLGAYDYLLSSESESPQKNASIKTNNSVKDEDKEQKEDNMDITKQPGGEKKKKIEEKNNKKEETKKQDADKLQSSKQVVNKTSTK